LLALPTDPLLKLVGAPIIEEVGRILCGPIDLRSVKTMFVGDLTVCS